MNVGETQFLSRPQQTRRNMFHIQSVLGVVGGTAAAYFAVRVVATVADIIGRWKRNDW
jgi:hypothetical protein